MFWENVFVREDFLSTEKKRVIENKTAFVGAQDRKFEVINAFSKYISITNYRFLKKKNTFYEFFEMRIFFGGRINDFKKLWKKTYQFIVLPVIFSSREWIFTLWSEFFYTYD